MHGIPGTRATRIRTLVSGLMTASLIAALIAPAATLASGTAPTAGVDNYTVLEDSGLNSFNLLSNDTDPELDPLTVTGFGNWTSAWGAKTWAADGTFTYTPTANYCKTSGTNNTYAFVNDGTNEVMGYIHIAVTCVNDEPVFTPGTDVTVNEDSGAYSAAWATGVGVGGGADEVGQTVTFHVSNDNNSLFSAQPAISSSGTLSFTPAANQHGSALVSVYLTDSGSNVDPNDNVTATLQFTIDVTSVEDAPVANGDSPTIAEDPADPVAIDVLANDTDGDGDVLTITDATTPANGTVAIDPDGFGLTYMPDANYCGADSFDYTITDGTTSDTATVSVTVSCVNDDPIAQDDTLGSGTEDQADPILIASNDVKSNDSDVEDSTNMLAFDAWGDTTVGGTVGLNMGTGNFEFTLNENFCGTASFDYTIIDNDGGTDTAVVYIDVACVNDAPIADDQNVSADENTDEAITLTATDVDSDTFTFTVTVNPTHGDVTCDADGSCTYTPDAGYHGPDEFSFSANDGDLDSAVDGVVSIDVAQDAVGPVAVAPTASFGTGRVDETAPIRLAWAASDPSGVTSYEVQVKVATGSWTAVYTGTATAVTKFYPFSKALVWRVRATDGEGNVGDWATNGTARTIVAYQGGSPVTYTGTWGTYPSAGSSGTGYRYTLSAGKTAVLRFTGLQVLYVAPKTAGSGSVIVYVDNVRLGTFSLRTASTTLGQIIARKTWGTSGTHTIKIVSVTAGRQTNLDAFVVLK